ncbi:phospho-N-acetylmuramoyl-pentapeptide-transferase [Gemmatimonas phototrophica]|uniref:Phospho-N-acetylmuramoyl-pentapeptide-transferase n=1 Tax=Gemmatimonas phototrophica TaxID=1379270 RepID=A0A143BJU6_9BACT|nr:phospho-N-acetylmuramoyl-pentapeptide-transferase [Gemmatimonas phototrophica]AMW04760.1 phospho-N-acetylmuramoyl-pentapeptide-transferase [Gemmatimonas phototrophica]
MLYYLLQPLARDGGVLNLLNYITFRATAAFVTALLLCFVFGPAIIRRLQAMAVHQVVRAGTPDSHAGKGTTPTMGGIIILVATFLPVLLWARLDNRYVVLAVAVTAWMGVIGFLDDYLKLKQKREGLKNEGLVERYKLAGQITCGLGLGTYLLLDPISTLPGASTTLPFFKYILVVPAVAWAAWLYIPWVTFILTGVSNAVNLTDGLDGLSSGLVAIAVLTLGIFAYLIGRVDTSAHLLIFYLRGAGELTVFCAAIVGACIGFLWYNAHPAQVFMGDTGSLALGGAVGAVAILLKSEFLLLFVGAVFFAETVSVILQRTVFKYRRRKFGLEYAQKHRVFLRAPLHHHFEMKGWPETQVVIRFWIIGILCAFVALSTLKLR